MVILLLLIVLLPLKQNPFLNEPAGNLTITKYVGAACVVYAAFYLVFCGRLPRYLGTWQARWYLLFTLVVFISYTQSTVTSTSSMLDTMNPVLTVTSLALMYFILLTVVDSVKRLHSVLLTTVGSMALASLYLLREWQKNRGWETGYRGGFVVGDENHFTISAITAIPLAWYAAQGAGPRWKRWSCRGCLLLMLASVIVGASRGGLVGLAVAMLFVAVRSRKRTRNVVVMLVLLLTFNVAYPHSPVQRLLHPNDSDILSERNHHASWQAGLKMAREHPITGVGFAAFKSQMHNYAPAWYDGGAYMAHNAYISVAAEMGVPALLLFLAVLIATFLSLERVHRKRSIPPPITQTAVALQAALVGCGVSIFFISAEYHEHLWFIVCLSMCLPPLADRFITKHAGALAASRSVSNWRAESPILPGRDSSKCDRILTSKAHQHDEVVGARH